MTFGHSYEVVVPLKRTKAAPERAAKELAASAHAVLRLAQEARLPMRNSPRL